MADSRPIHGYNSRIQIEAAVIAGANGWTFTSTAGTVEATEFEDAKTRNLGGQISESGSLTC